jgi:hypothetical protein
MRPEAPIPTSGSDGKLDLGDSYLDGGGGAWVLVERTSIQVMGISIVAARLGVLALGSSIWAARLPRDEKRRAGRRNKHLPQSRRRC